MADKTLEVRALQVKQDGKTPLYSFFIRAKHLLDIADISRIKRNDNGTLLGYQRGQVETHVKEIVEYLNSDNVLFPNAIILAMSSDVKFKQSRGPQTGDSACAPGTLELPIKAKGQRVSWIVDGQQRTIALTQSKSNDIMVPVTGFVSDDFEVHRAQFLLVNKAKPLPKGLINELLPEVNTMLPASLARNKIPSALCDVLHKDPESPFKGMIVRQTTDRKKEKTAVIADNSLIQIIRNSLNNVHGCLYQYRNVASGEVDIEAIRAVLNHYWEGVRQTFPDAWGLPPTRSRLMHGAGIKSMGVLMDRVMSNILPNDTRAVEKVVRNLKPLKPYCAWTDGTWEKINGVPWNQLQNTARDVNLLSNMLIRVYTGVE
jgi:DGQHR domain-containing protein